MTSATAARSLQREEARARAALLRVRSYDVVLDLTGDTTFTSRTTIVFDSDGGDTFLDVKPVSLSAISHDGAALDVDRLERGRYPLRTTAGENTVVVDAVMPFRNDGEGLHLSTDPADGRRYVYGMCFMDAAPTVFACFDQPDLKAPYTMRVTAPAEWTVVGNAPAAVVEEAGSGTGDGARVWALGPTQPLSTYFVTIVAGPYHVLRDSHDGIPLGLSARASLAAPLERDAEELFTITGQCFDEFHRLFGIRYPFGDYHQAFVPEFNAGAMENPGCVTFRDAFVFESRVLRGERVQRAVTIAHEMAHQWFGNLVTPRWWDDLWLNESFAEYMGNRVAGDVTEYTETWTEVSWGRRQWGLRADQRPSTHPVAGNGAVDAVAALQDFDGISYSKGSSILRQLATTLGDGVFLGGAVDHFTRHRFGNAAMGDLVASWERAGAQDLAPVLDEWLRTAGPDEFRLDRDAGVLLRTPPADRPADRAHTFSLVSAEPDAAGGGWSEQPVAVTGPSTAVRATPTEAVVIDPREQSWGVYVPDAVTVRGLVSLLPGLDDVGLTAGAWNNVRSGYSVAAVDPDDVVDLVEAAYSAADTLDGPRHMLPWLLRDVIPLASPGSRARMHAAALACSEAQEPGSEWQLSAFRGALATAVEPTMLRGWLDGPPAGIDVDLDLRWRLLRRLAVLGAVDVAELDAALAQEPTAVSRVHHAQARASMPTAEAKTWAWERFTGAVDVSNYELEAAGVGFWAAGLDGAGSAVNREYVARYAEDLPGTASVRSGWNLATSAAAFFPLGHTDDETLALLTPLLADGVLEPAVRRQVADQLDDLERRLSVRRAFPKPSEGRT